MSGSAWIRRSHRWVAIVFTLTVIANFVARALSPGAPPPWITYAPLLPLAVLLFSGLYVAVELAMLEWVPWFNHHRLLEPIGYIPPAEAEANCYKQLASQATTVEA